MALREAKCFRRSTACAGQTSEPVQRRATSASPVFSSISRSAAEPQRGQTCGNSYGFAPCGRFAVDHFDNLRNDIAGALHDHRVADANVLAGDFVLVVQRGVRHDDAADGDGLEARDRRQRAGAPDLNFDAAQDRRRALGREFMRRPPSAARARRSRAAFCSAMSSTL